jgi:hypothetical protein
VLNIADGRSLATEEMRAAVKFEVAGEARRSWPAGGSLAKEDQGLEKAQAICSGWEVEMMAEWPGVSISWGGY